MAAQAKVVMYGTAYCPYCVAARTLLAKKGVQYEDISVFDDKAKRAEMETKSGGHTVPQILIDDRAIGGFDELYELDESGELDRLLGLD